MGCYYTVKGAYYISLKSQIKNPPTNIFTYFEQAKADKKANREAELQFREEEKKKKDLEDAEKEKAALKEKEEEERAEEEEKRRKEEKERKEQEEYEKLIASFEVDEEGFDETSCMDGEGENQLQVFIQYIKVSLELL